MSLIKEKKKLSNNLSKLLLAAISVPEWPQKNAKCGENIDGRKKNWAARLTIEKSERVARCHDRRASVKTCDNGLVSLAYFYDVKFQNRVVSERGTVRVFPPVLRVVVCACLQALPC